VCSSDLGMQLLTQQLGKNDRVAIVVDEDGKYHGLITKIDMINDLRRRLV